MRLISVLACMRLYKRRQTKNLMGAQPGQFKLKLVSPTQGYSRFEISTLSKFVASQNSLPTSCPPSNLRQRTMMKRNIKIARQNLWSFESSEGKLRTSHTWTGKAGYVARTSEEGGVCSLRIHVAKFNPNFDVKLKTVQSALNHRQCCSTIREAMQMRLMR